MRMRIIVADESEARFYDAERADGALHLAGKLSDPAARLHDRDFKSDRPGRVFDHAPAGAARRGSVAHHGTGGERRPRRHEAEAFAQRIVAELEQARRRKSFDRLILIAGPPFLGVLRAALTPGLSGMLAAEVHKDLVHQADRVVREHLPAAAFAPPGD